MTVHAKYAPSSAFRTRLCPASPYMESLYPQEDTVEKREGSAVHWAGAELLGGQEVAEGQVADNDVVLNIEMISAAYMWADYIRARGPVGSVETTITEPALHQDNWGTPDHWWWDADNWTLYVDDLKYGHRFVDVYLNWQLMNYAALILRKIGMYGVDRVRIVFTLVLPRCFSAPSPVQTWTTTLGEIDPYLKDLAAAFRAADDPNAPCDASDIEACFDCSARHNCAANIEATGIAITVTSQPIPLHLTPAAMARLRKVLRNAEERIKSMREGVDQSITQTIRRKQAVPHFTLQSRPGREVFVPDAAQNGIIEIGRMFGVNVVKEQSLITPRQAIDAGIPAHLVKLYSRKNSGALELVEDDGSMVSRIFNQQE